MQTIHFIKVLVVSLSVFLSLFTSVHAVETSGAKLGEWTMDYDAAVVLAKKESKPILVGFTKSDRCSWCKLMEKNVFEKKAWKDYAAKNLVLVTIDYPKDKSIVPTRFVQRNKDLAQQMKIQGVPFYVLLDADGKTRLAKLGGGKEKTPKSFIQEIDSSIKAK
jgi:thioredoxin-related protein